MNIGAPKLKVVATEASADTVISDGFKVTLPKGNCVRDGYPSLTARTSHHTGRVSSLSEKNTSIFVINIPLGLSHITV